MIFAISVFIGTYVWLMTEKTPRHLVALSAAIVLVLGRVFTFSEALRQINWQTIALIVGMFLIVEALLESGFFHW
jgi:Na+/H+ antiporter NhaD/arsenite permease-like protein